MKLKSALSALTLALASTYAVADPPDFHGYFRAGAGQNKEGGDMTCFGLPGAQAKYRLGNECDNYGEFLFSADVVKGKDGSLWRGHVMFNTADNGFPSTGGGNGDHAGINQMYISGQDITPGLKGATLWAGKRFYDRVHFDDNDQFLIMGDGTGAGIEDINTGGGKFGFDYMRRFTQSTPFANATLVAAEWGAKFTDIPVNPDGKLGLWGYYLNDSKNDNSPNNKPANFDQTTKGFRFHVTHNQGNVLGGNNLAVLSYGKGGLSNGSYDLKQNSYDPTGFDGDKAWRLADSLFIAFPGSMFDMNMTFVYQKTSVDDSRRTLGRGDDQKWLSFGVLPMFHFNDIMAIALELGHDEVDVENGNGKQKLDKMSIVLSASAGPNKYSRPTVRLFYTYAKWNDAAQRAGIVGQSFTTDPVTGAVTCNASTSVFGCAKNGSNFGVQGEVWF
jgi:maltoporin